MCVLRVPVREPRSAPGVFSRYWRNQRHAATSAARMSSTNTQALMVSRMSESPASMTVITEQRYSFLQAVPRRLLSPANWCTPDLDSMA